MEDQGDQWKIKESSNLSGEKFFILELSRKHDDNFKFA